MRVKQLMSAPAATVAPGDSLHIADGIMSLGVVRHLPVVSGGALVGVVSQRDILRSPGLLSPVLGLAIDTGAALKTLRVEDAMSPTIVTIGADASVREAAERMLNHRVGCLPVVDGGELVGVITTSDLLRSIVDPSCALASAQPARRPC